MTPILTRSPTIKAKDVFYASLLHRDHEFALCPKTFVQNQFNLASLYYFQLLLYSAVWCTIEPRPSHNITSKDGLRFHSSVLALLHNEILQLFSNSSLWSMVLWPDMNHYKQIKPFSVRDDHWKNILKKSFSKPYIFITSISSIKPSGVCAWMLT